MTYLSSGSRMRRRYGRPRARAQAPAPMGDWIDALSLVNPFALIYNIDGRIFDATVDHLASGVGTKCIGEAEEKVAPMDGTILDIHKTWDPGSDYFEPSDVRAMVSSISATLVEAINQISQAPRSSDDAESTIDQVRSGMQKRLAGAQAFLQTASEAQVRNIPVEAPGLKEWMLSALRNARQGMLAAYYLECSVTWIERALGAVMRVLDAAWQLIKDVVGLVIDVAQEVLKVPNALATLVQYCEYGLLAYGAYWLYKKYKARGG